MVRFAFEDDLKATAREWCHLSWCTTVMLAPPGYAKMKTVRKGPEGEDHEKAVLYWKHNFLFLTLLHPGKLRSYQRVRDMNLL